MNEHCPALAMWKCTDGWLWKRDIQRKALCTPFENVATARYGIFQPDYIHNHWKVQTNYDFDKIQAAFKSKIYINRVSVQCAETASSGISDVDDNGILNDNEDINSQDERDMEGNPNR